MTRRTCESCGRSWVTYGPHDPCPDCGHTQRLAFGVDSFDSWAREVDWHDRPPAIGILDGIEQELPME